MREMRTDGVTVISAAETNWKKLRTVDGRVETKCMKVLYDAMMIGGNGGRAGCEAASGVGTVED
jgi:hypothetical protein